MLDYGSRAPISEGNHIEYRIQNNNIGIKIKTHRVKSHNMKDRSLTKLAELAQEDVMYMRMVAHLENIREDCELRKMRGDIQHIGLLDT